MLLGLNAVDPADAAYQQLVQQGMTQGSSDQNPGAWPDNWNPDLIVNVTPTSTTYTNPATGQTQTFPQSNTSSLLLLAGAVALAVFISK